VETERREGIEREEGNVAEGRNGGVAEMEG